MAVMSYTMWLYLTPGRARARARTGLRFAASFSKPTSTTSATSTTTTTSTGSHGMTLYQYAICPYCNIAKTVLHYTRTPYQALEVNPLTKAELKKLDADSDGKLYDKVPVLVRLLDSDESQQINGSDAIVDYLLENATFIDAASPSAVRWTTFAREDLAPLLYPNLCNTLGNSFRAFGYVHRSDSPFSLGQRLAIQWIGSLAMYLAASKIKRKRNISDERAALMKALEEFDTELEKVGGGDHSFLSGSSIDQQSNQPTPHLGDLTIYGVLRGLQGLPVMEDMVYPAYPRIRQWYRDMEQVVEK